MAPGAVPAGFEGSAYTKAREIPARIITFTAQPLSIRAEQPVSLVWHTENPAAVTIDSVTQRLKAPKGSFYYRFASRDALLMMHTFCRAAPPATCACTYVR